MPSSALNEYIAGVTMSRYAGSIGFTTVAAKGSAIISFVPLNKVGKPLPAVVASIVLLPYKKPCADFLYCANV